MNTRALAASVVVVLATTGCKPPPEAESLTLTEAIPAFFRDFDQDSAALPNLVVQLEAGLDEEGIDIDAEDHKTRALTLDPLTDAFLGGANAPDGVEAADQTPVVVFGRSTFDFDTNKETALEPNQVCIESDSTVQYTRTYTEGEACFRDGSCDVTRSDVEIRKELSFIAAGWFDLFKDFRTFEIEDGRRAMIARSWAEEVAAGDKGNAEFRQSYTAELYVEDGDTTIRMYAIWSEIQIGLGADAMRALITDSLEEGYENADAFSTDGHSDCKNDRDAVIPRE